MGIELEPDGVNLCYFKLRLFDLTEFIVWKIKGHWVLKIRVRGEDSIPF